jgi:phospholipid transport system substrate-binding protein
MRKVFGVLWAAGAAALLLAQPVWAASDPSQLVKSVTAQVIDIVKTKTGAPREAAFREVLRNNFDLPYMGRQALGTHWGEASAQQRARFLAALETAEARAYSERLGKLAAYTLTIDNVVARASGVWIVNALLTQASGQLIKLEWEVHDNGQGPRIADVKVAGVSMSQIKRSEFNSYIQNNGGTVELLVQQLEARAAR